MKLQADLSKLAGVPIEITIRGDRAFTISFDKIDAAITAKLVSFFSSGAKVSVETDDELDATFVYLDA